MYTSLQRRNHTPAAPSTSSRPPSHPSIHPSITTSLYGTCPDGSTSRHTSHAHLHLSTVTPSRLPSPLFTLCYILLCTRYTGLLLVPFASLLWVSRGCGSPGLFCVEFGGEAYLPTEWHAGDRKFVTPPMAPRYYTGS
jgi:hypothetical protein